MNFKNLFLFLALTSANFVTYTAQLEHALPYSPLLALPDILSRDMQPNMPTTALTNAVAAKTYSLEKISNARIEAAQQEIIQNLYSRTRNFYALTALGAAAVIGSFYLGSNYFTNTPALKPEYSNAIIPRTIQYFFHGLAKAENALGFASINNEQSAYSTFMASPINLNANCPGNSIGWKEGLYLNKHKILANATVFTLSATQMAIISPFLTKLNNGINNYLNSETSIIWFVNTHTKLETCLRNLDTYCKAYENSANDSVHDQIYYKNCLYVSINLTVRQIEKILAYMIIARKEIMGKADQVNKLNLLNLTIDHIASQTNYLVDLIDNILPPENLAGSISVSNKINAYIKDLLGLISTCELK